jgi:hypothetical protein
MRNNNHLILGLQAKGRHQENDAFVTMAFNIIYILFIQFNDIHYQFKPFLDQLVDRSSQVSMTAGRNHYHRLLHSL